MFILVRVRQSFEVFILSDGQKRKTIIISDDHKRTEKKTT